MKILSKIKKILKNHFYKAGFKTDRHIIVFESDDWGSVRNSSKENIKKLTAKYPNEKFNCYQTIDTLETDEDVMSLKSVLSKHKDSKGLCAKFTLNFAMANPDFDKTRESNCENIYLESIEETYNRSIQSKNVLSLVKDNQINGCFKPQLHTREHFNSAFLLNDLKTNQLVKDAFDLNIIGVTSETYNGLDTLNNADNEEIIKQSVKDFENTFGFKPKSFVAPCYVWKSSDEQLLHSLGIKMMQTKLFQNIPTGRNKYRKKIHIFGQKNKKSGIIYSIRNCFFEPTRETFIGKSNQEIIDNALEEIDFAFRNKKPAVICSHRMNYTSSINKDNRTSNLMMLDKLLKTLEEKYPDLEYKFSDELIDIMNGENKC